MTSGRSLTAADRELLEQLLVEFGPRWLGYARRMAGRPGEAEDILAEALCRAADNIEAVRKTDRRDLYVLTTIRNLCRDEFRRRRPEAIGDERMSRVADVRGIENASSLESQQSQVLVAVNQLPDALREIVALRLSGQFSFEDIAKLLNVPLGTALSRMHVAVRKLREILGVQETGREAAV